MSQLAHLSKEVQCLTHIASSSCSSDHVAKILRRGWPRSLDTIEEKPATRVCLDLQGTEQQATPNTLVDVIHRNLLRQEVIASQSRREATLGCAHLHHRCQHCRCGGGPMTTEIMDQLNRLLWQVAPDCSQDELRHELQASGSGHVADVEPTFHLSSVAFYCLGRLHSTKHGYLSSQLSRCARPKTLGKLAKCWLCNGPTWSGLCGSCLPSRGLLRTACPNSRSPGHYEKYSKDEASRELGAEHIESLNAKVQRGVNVEAQHFE
mmetsp:Transcript_45076/g.104425  ORF Transcript_45076/g.104425 Transcript_45076/m.104425 type:complete len:264 (-) Transcript_45076:225-1016(-)